MGLGDRKGHVAKVVQAMLAMLIIVAPAHSQEPSPEPAAKTPPPMQELDQQGGGKPRSWFRRMFFDEEDGKLDLSNNLSKGGFIPMPVIITEPAVDGGFGIVAQFVTMPQDNPQLATRRILGVFKTGNDSHGYGYFQTGHAFDGRVKYKFGAGRGKINLAAHPRFAPSGVNYTNTYDYGIVGSAFWRLPDDRFSVGPLLDFRQLTSKINVQGLPEDFAKDFGRKLNTGALGLGLHFDSRDNPISPTEGVNAFLDGKFNTGTFGSDRNYEVYDLDVYAFHKPKPKWHLGFKTEIDAIRGNFPSFFAPSIDLRGVEAIRYQGSTVQSSEIELVRRLNERWAILAFAGAGAAYSGKSRIFDNSGVIFAGGAGVRYRIARKQGIDMGIDVAAGPGGGVIYLQFGHAWTFSMD